MALVFDALDEGEIRAGDSNFEAFMKDLCSLSRSTRAKPSLVVLARGETATLARLHFEDQHINYASYVVDFFNEQAAREFLNLRLDEINLRSEAGSRARHRQYVHQFNEAVSTLFEIISRAIVPERNGEYWEDQRVKSFLGYAPVLTALAEVLRVQNYSRLVRELRTSAPWLALTKSAWQVLSTIVMSLIRREQTKVIDNARPRMQPGADSLHFDDWSSLFGVEEQIIRVLARALRVPLPEHLPRGLAGQLRDPYEDAIAAMLPQHPFLSDMGFSSVVFEEFLYAHVVQYGPEWLREVARERMREASYLPSPLLGYFMLETTDQDERSVVHAEDIGIFMNSLQSRAMHPGEFLLAIGIADNGAAALEGYVWTADTDGNELRFDVDNPEAGIIFWRRASYCFINVPIAVQLSSEGSFRLGPDIYIECRTFEVRTNDMVVDTGLATDSRVMEDGSGVVLIAQSYADAGVPPRLRVFGKQELQISWPDAIYPWVDYRVSFATSDNDEDQVPSLYQLLRRILRGFGGSAVFGGTIGRAVRYIDSVAVGSSQLANDLLAYLVETELLSIQGARYVLDMEKAAVLGLSFTTLRANTITAATRNYLQAFADKTERS